MNTSRSIGDRPLALAGYLRKAADLLLDTETAKDYDWSKCTRCNVGMLGRAITGMDVDKFYNEIPRTGGTWSLKMLGVGVEDNVVVAQMLKAGIDPSDIEHLEFLCHPDLKRAEWSDTPKSLIFYQSAQAHYREVSNAVWYLLEWAKKIEAFHAERAAALQPITLDHSLVTTQPCVACDTREI
jgi:hypothetical protein